MAAPRGRSGGDSGFRVFGYSGSGAVARPHHVSERGAVARPHHVSERGAVLWPRHVAAGEEQGFVVFQKQCPDSAKLESELADQRPARTGSTLVSLMRNAVSLAHTPGIAVTDLDVKCKTSTGSNVSDSAFSVASDKPTAEPVDFTKVCHHTFMDVISSDMGSKLVSSNSAVMTGMRTEGGRGD